MFAAVIMRVNSICMQIFRRNFTYREDFFGSAVLRLLQLPQLLHESFGANGGVYFRNYGQFGSPTAAGRYCATAKEINRIKTIPMTTKAIKGDKR